MKHSQVQDYLILLTLKKLIHFKKGDDMDIKIE